MRTTANKIVNHSSDLTLDESTPEIGSAHLDQVTKTSSIPSNLAAHYELFAGLNRLGRSVELRQRVSGL